MAAKLSSVSASNEDIDLWVGGLLETKAPGAIFGQTFRDAIAEQFVRLKKGDKYFFDHDPTINSGYFTQGLYLFKKTRNNLLICCITSQLQELKKSSNV